MSAIVSVYIGDALKGLEGTIIDYASIERALIALPNIIYYIPSRTGSDYKCDDPEYKAIQSQAARALEAFSIFLPASPSSAKECAFEVHNVLNALREHGERAGLMSVELRRAIVRYWDSANEEIPWYLRKKEQPEWIQTLRREMDDSGQKLPAGVASTSGGIADPLTIAAPAAVSHDSVSIAAASQQISGTRDGIQMEMVPVNGSSTPSTSPPPTAHIAPAVVHNECVSSARGETDAHPPTELDANGRSASAASPPCTHTEAVDKSADSHPGAVETERGAQLAATEFSIGAPPFPDHTATVNEPAVSVPGTAEGDRGACSQEELVTNGSSSASSTLPPSSGGSGLP
ncbi:hypothetical protein OH76DRAFT_506740 [Lentinus brumalis]|uniref:Uncharacterized protein n=1 Tax=Lentinus brumalis TaxID=2498619 RepID=A0A371DAX6_9APHY|nr:hypothetical protein OH76DRAFT_506740 [Polyporus brumalis]